MRPGDFTIQEFLMTLTLIKTCTSQGEENAAVRTTRVHSAFDSGLSIALKDVIN